MINQEAIRKAVRELLIAIGENPDREGLLDTPDRVARMYTEIYAGYEQDPAAILSRTFAENHQELVLEKDISFHSHCEHHTATFFGKVHIAYIPNGKVVGISKLARLVDCYAKRLQIQERMTSDIADAIEKYLGATGVAVIIEAEHLCMTMRGVRKAGTKTVTSAMRGLFKLDDKARNEVLMLIK